MNFERKPKNDREYQEMLYSLLTEMNGSIMAQVRSINNTMGKVLLVMVDVQNSMNVLSNGLKENRDARYQQEIDQLEMQITNMRQAVEEKKVAKQNTLSTSQEIRSVVVDAITKQREEEIKKKQIDWGEQFRKALPGIISFLVGIVLLFLIPQFGKLLIAIFQK